jgi:hypothetical protein
VHVPKDGVMYRGVVPGSNGCCSRRGDVRPIWACMQALTMCGLLRTIRRESHSRASMKQTMR